MKIKKLLMIFLGFIVSCNFCVAKDLVTQIAGISLEQHEFKDGAGRNIKFYLSHPKKDKAPLLLMIQGSGCAPVIVNQPSNSYSTLFNLIPFANEGDFAVMAVEKPFATGGNNFGGAEGCAKEFNQDFTAESWLTALQESIAHAQQNSWVDKKQTLVIGLSEGAVMASLLAGRNKSITHVALSGGSGTTQLFDFVAKAYTECWNVGECLNDVDSTLEKIQKNPDAADQFAWGHTYKRWSSFLKVDPSEELLKSSAKIYWVFGTQDQSTPPLSQEVAITKLKAAKKDLTVKRIPNANHMLLQNANPNFDDLDKELRAILVWFGRQN